jgi:2-haloacid dehalogenase
MEFSRRQFANTSVAAGLLMASKSRNASRTKAVVFDAFPILDSRPVFATAQQLFPEKGAELSTLWRNRQFEYTWLRSLSGHYGGFWQVTGDALAFAAKTLDIELTHENRTVLMNAWLQLRCWPEAPGALGALKRSGLRLAFLSNMSLPMLEAGIRNSGLETMFDRVLSTDLVRVFKPDPRAYRAASDALHLPPHEITFAASAGWDAAGSSAFGFKTFWVNRMHQPPEELEFAADAAGSTLDDLVAWIMTEPSRRRLPPASPV